MTKLYYDDTNPEAVKILKDYYDFKYLIKILNDETKNCNVYSIKQFDEYLKIVKVVLNKIDLEFLLNSSKLFYIQHYNDVDIEDFLRIDEDTTDDEIMRFKAFTELELFLIYFRLYNIEYLLINLYRKYIKKHPLFSTTKN
jgi:hypothetical protein